MAKKAKKTRASQQSGFTLIELLAVITIMGILMMVAIPAISRTIENSRRDTFMNTAKSYAGAIQNSVASDEIKCWASDDATSKTAISALPAGTSLATASHYVYFFNSANTTGTDLMESGGKSSWGSANVTGYVVIAKYATNVGSEGLKTTHYDYYVSMTDGTHGIKDPVLLADLGRSKVLVSGGGSIAAPTGKKVTVKLNGDTQKQPYVCEIS